jgi:DNA invertase Pin-like site-specific DNA recombinase
MHKMSVTGKGTMLIGYARTSTTDQIAGLEAQERDLLAQGCERLWKEQTSALGPRNALEEVIAFARAGDSLVVTAGKEGREPSNPLDGD